MKLYYLAALAPMLLLTACASTGGMAPSLTATLKCDGPDFNKRDSKGKPEFDEEGMAKTAELNVRMRGAKTAHMTRFWNGCIQTFVKDPRPART
jgi:hypothetical protein